MRVKRTLLIVCGTVSVALGIVGAFTPVLPTTPFLLLAAYCYGRSSERFLHWLLTNRFCGRYIRDYREGRGLPRREKGITLALLWATILASVVFFVSALWLRLLLVGIAVAVTVHVVRIGSGRRDRARRTTSPDSGLVSRSSRRIPHK